MKHTTKTTEGVEVYYERLLKLANFLQVKVTIFFFTIVLRASLLPYLRLTTASMKRNTLIEHKEVVVVCEESGPISMNYNVLLTTLEVNVGVEPVVLVVIIKSTSTCTNCGKTGHLVETCHNKKIKVLVVPTATVKSTKLVARTKTEPVKSGKLHVHYPCIICSNVEHRSRECPRKIEV